MFELGYDKDLNWLKYITCIEDCSLLSFVINITDARTNKHTEYMTHYQHWKEVSGQNDENYK